MHIKDCGDLTQALGCVRFSFLASPLPSVHPGVMQHNINSWPVVRGLPYDSNRGGGRRNKDLN